MLAVGKKVGPAVGAMDILVERCEPLGIGLVRMNDPQRVAIVRGVDDGVVGTPCAAAWIWSVGDGRNRTTGHGNNFEFSFCKKSEGEAVRRPERKCRAVGACKLSGRVRIERLNPDGFSLFRTVCAERDLGAVGGEDRRAGEVTVEIESGV